MRVCTLSLAFSHSLCVYMYSSYSHMYDTISLNRYYKLKGSVVLRKRVKKQLRQWVKFKGCWFLLRWWWWWWQRWLHMIMGTRCQRVSCSLKARDQGNYPLIKEWLGGRIQLFVMVLTLVLVFLPLLVVKFFYFFFFCYRYDKIRTYCVSSIE